MLDDLFSLPVPALVVIVSETEVTGARKRHETR